MTLAEVDMVLLQAATLLHALRREKLPATMGDDTAFSLGRALGALDNARTLLERDIAKAGEVVQRPVAQVPDHGRDIDIDDGA
jgi:hypothetical protein